MSGRKTIEEFLVQIDEDLVTYAGEFRKQGFTSNNSMKHWREADFELINLPVPEGHRRLIMNAVLAMSITPPAKTKRKNRPSVGESPETKAYCSESVAKYGACSATSTSRKSLISSRRRLTVSDETPDFKLLDQDSDDEGGIDDLIAANIRPKVDKKTVTSPLVRYIKSKQAEVCRTSEEIEKKRQELEDMIQQVEDASSLMGKTGQRCSHCHKRNHTIRSCKENKCDSSFVCGMLSKHPEEKKQFDERKRSISALETSLKKLQQELASRETAFHRVNNSVDMNIENMLTEEYPEDYMVDGTRNWLKLQKDVALVKKHIRNSSDLTRNKIKSIIGENSGISMPPRMDRICTDKPKTAMQRKLESYGVNFPVKSKNCESALAFSKLQPNSEDEEIEQLRMATRLSLVTRDINVNVNEEITHNTVETCASNSHSFSNEAHMANEEAANILLGMSRCGDN
jgi:hypothetical protein